MDLLVAPLVLAWTMTAAGLFAQDEWQQARAVVRTLQQTGPESLEALVDFELRGAERVWRGTAERCWPDLDDTTRARMRRDTLGRWMRAQRLFRRQAALWDAQPVADPEQGAGPAMGRILVRAVLRDPATRRLRQLLITATTGGRVLDLAFGEPYRPDEDIAQLAPVPLPRGSSLEPVHWPSAVDDLERQEVTALVSELLDQPDGPGRDETIKQLHLLPRAAVTALVQRLAALDEGETEAGALLAHVLTRITGRCSTYEATASAGEDRSQLAAANREEQEAWRRWHTHHGSSFLPADLPAATRRAPAPPTADLGGAAARPPRPAAAAPRAAAAPTRSAAPVSPAEEGPAAQDTPGATPQPSASTTARKPVPKPRRVPTQRDILFSAAAALPVFVDGARSPVPAREIERRLSDPLREALNTWAEAATQGDLAVVVGLKSETLVLGRAKLKSLRDAELLMESTLQLLGDVIPRIQGRPSKAVVAVILDRKGQRSGALEAVLDQLEERRMVDQAGLSSLRSSEGGALLRGIPMFVQLTYDVAGEGEFRFENEVIHKYAQCLLTERAGDLTPLVRWSLGYSAELELTGSMYLFNSDFAAEGSHSDWPTTARQLIEKKKRGKYRYLVSDLALRDEAAGLPEAPQRVTWGALDYLLHQEPDVLTHMLSELAAVSAGGSDARAQRRAVFVRRLDAIGRGALIRHLKRRR